MSKQSARQEMPAQLHLKEFYHHRKSTRKRSKSLSDGQNDTSMEKLNIPKIRIVKLINEGHGDDEVAPLHLSDILEGLRKSNSCLDNNYKEFKSLSNRIFDRMSVRSDSHSVFAESKTRPPKSLLHAICAICAVIILSTHSEGTLEIYRDIIRKASATVFDVSLCIELAIRHEPLLSLERIEILKDWERNLLAFYVWQEEEPLYSLLSLEEQKDLSSPLKAVCSMQSVENQSSSQKTVISRLEFFFRKFLRMAAGRIDCICTDLQLSDFSRSACWSLFVRTLEMEVGVRLFFRRHYIQVLIATVCSVAKFYDENRPFTRIISVLQSQLGHQAFPDSLFRAVYMGPDQPTADLVKFYNDIYLPRMRDRIYKLPPVDSIGEQTPKTPDRRSRRRFSFCGNDQILPMPTSMSPVSPTIPRHLTEHVTLDMSPCKKHLSKLPTFTKSTPLKLSAFQVCEQPSDALNDPIQDKCSTRDDATRPSTPVARRLDF